MFFFFFFCFQVFRFGLDNWREKVWHQIGKCAWEKQLGRRSLYHVRRAGFSIGAKTPPRGCEEKPEPVLVCLMRCHVVKIDCFVTRTASCDKVGEVSFASYWLPAHIVPRGVFDLQMSYYTIYMDKPLIYR